MSTPNTALAAMPAADLQTREAPGFNSLGSWQLANRIGQAFAASTIVPQAYQNNVANCIVALEMANRMNASPLQVMQNLYIVHGNPGWSSKFLVACFNQCGRFSALRYEFNEDRSACRAWAVEKATGERIDGPQVTLQMAQAEGWSTKSCSKWKTMPELMLMYRSAAFLIRTYAPEISMGMQTEDELVDITPTHDDGQALLSGKPLVEMPRALGAEPAPPAGTPVDPATGEIQQQPQEAEQPQQEPGQPATAGAPAQQQEAAKKPAAAPQPGVPATEGERKLIIKRAQNNNLVLADLVKAAGLDPLPDDLAGLTKDGFIALRDQLPSAV